MTTNHTLIVAAIPAGGDIEYQAEIVCHGVTDACAEWTECFARGCPLVTAEEDLEGVTTATAHSIEHRWFDEEVSREFWGVRSGQCYAVVTGDTPAEEFAEERKLATGRYPVTVELDGATIIIALALEEQACPAA